MKLYHATNYENGLSIEKDGFIKPTATQNSPYKDYSPNFQTTPGYVYLTDSLYHAIDIALTPYLGNRYQVSRFYIFEVDLPADQVTPDFDEEKYDMEFAKHCFRYDKEIPINKSKVFHPFFTDNVLETRKVHGKDLLDYSETELEQLLTQDVLK